MLPRVLDIFAPSVPSRFGVPLSKGSGRANTGP